MFQTITIIMYHYVRDLAHSRYPELKCLDEAAFVRQLDHLERRYAFVSAEALARALDGGEPLPDRACLLTFDDGYLDHYLTVFPELFRRGIPGAFYPAVMATECSALMEVNKIQLILAANGYADMAPLCAAFRELFEDARREPDYAALPPYPALYAEYARASRYDGPDTMFLKAMLQYALPPALRTRLVDSLYARAVGVDERVLAREMYMSVDMLRVMAQNGMHIGSHGDRHCWLDKLGEQELARELDASLAMLRRVHGDRKFMWSVCYPFGGHNDLVRGMCAARGCAFGVTTKPETAVVDPSGRFTLARLDTNDFPKD